MSINQDKKVALLVHSCDRYEFLFRGFEFFFNRHWNFTIPCNYYFATEEKAVSINGFTNILSGKGPWTDRLTVLLNKIPEEYVIYMQEDMWLNKDVNVRFFQELFLIAPRKKWLQVKLHSSEVYKTTATDSFIEGFNIATLDNAASDFLMSHQITLWNKEFLLKQLPKGEHPWRNERKGTKRIRKINPVIYYADYFAENGKPEINTNNHPVMRSEYRTISVNGTLNNDILCFAEVLKTSNEADKAYAEKLIFHYENKLTHDGRPKPKKEDIFKKIKNWIQKKS